MNNLPVLRERERPSKQLIRAAEAQRRTELAVFQHNLSVRYAAECERIEAQALSDVIRTSMDEELGILDWGMEQAAGSPAKAELVARKVALMSRINSARIARRFGA